MRLDSPEGRRCRHLLRLQPIIGSRPSHLRRSASPARSPNCGTRTAEIGTAPVFTEKDGRTTLQIPFDPAGSVFVIFRKSSSQVDAVVSATRDGGDAFVDDAGGELTIEKAVYGRRPKWARPRWTSPETSGSHPKRTAQGDCNNDLCGRDPAFGVVKQLWVDYSYTPKNADAPGRIQKRAVVGEEFSWNCRRPTNAPWFAVI